MKLTTRLTTASLVASLCLFGGTACGQKPVADTASEDAHGHAEDEHDHAHAEDEHDHAADEHASGEDEHAHAEGEAGPDEHGHGEAAPVSVEVLESQGVTVGTAGPGTIGESLELTGEITMDPDRMGHVVPRVSGVVQSVRGSLGERVGAGQTLLVIHSRDLAAAKSAYRAAVAEEKLAKTRFDRESQLREKGITPEQDYLDAKHAYEMAQINRELAESELHALGVSEAGVARLAEGHGVDEASITISAPLGGTILEKHVSVGELVMEGEELYLIADLSRVWVQLTIPPAQLASVQPGQRVTITGQSGAGVGGTIDFISGLVEGASRGAQARVRLANPDGRWRPGQFVSGVLELSQNNAAVVVPSEAVQMMENMPHVFVREADHYEPREVTVGRRSGDRVEILSGLAPGEKYAATGAFLIKAEIGKGEAEHEH